MIEDIVHEATMKFPPELVWKAMTTHEGLGAWLMVNDFKEPKVGHQFTFKDRPRPFWDGICRCEVTAAEPQRQFALRWGINAKGESTSVAWKLDPTPDGCTKVTFRHSGLQGVMGWIMKKGMAKDWQRMLDRSIPMVCERMAKGEVPTREEIAQCMKG